MATRNPQKKSARQAKTTLSTRQQMEAIISPLRQDIIEAFTAAGPCPIKRIALELGKSADSIYYHVRKLLDVGLLRHIETRRTKRRDEAIYDVPSEKLELSYNLDDPSIADAMRRIAASMLRRASKYFDAATAGKSHCSSANAC